MATSSALRRNEERRLRLVEELPTETQPRLAPVSDLRRRPTVLKRVEQKDPAPDPSPALVRVIAIQGYEVLTGARAMHQIAPLITLGLQRQLTYMRDLWAERRRVYRDHRLRSPKAGGVRIDRPSDRTAEATVVLHVGARAHGVALSFVWAHEQWRATELCVL